MVPVAIRRSPSARTRRSYASGKTLRHLPVAAFCLLNLLPASGSTPPPRGLTFEDRVEAQKAIERVYYSHQIGTTLPFEEAVPRHLLERKVRTTLKQSEALEKLWNTPITSAALAREVERMASTTRIPERLQELFSALGDDPARIQECLARPVLAERLLESFYSADERTHAFRRAEAESVRQRLRHGALDPGEANPQRLLVEFERAGETGPNPAPEEESADTIPGNTAPRRLLSSQEFDAMRRGFEEAEGGIGELREEKDRFVVPVLLKEGSDRLLVAEFSVSKVPLEDWWRKIEKDFQGSEPSMGSRAGGGAGIPLSLSNPGIPDVTSTPEPSPQIASCFADNTWDGVDLSGLPSPRSGHTVVWTGSVMIVWGGFLSTGGRYDPATDSWLPTSIVGAPEPRSDHTALWTGSEMLVWGGAPSSGPPFDNGGRYNPLTNTWASISTSGPAPDARSLHTAVWTGDRMVVWGGNDGTGAALASGARYNPATDSWQATASSGAPTARFSHTAIWTGSTMIVWGGAADATTNVGDGAIYTLSTNSWSPMSGTNAPSPRSGHTAIWTGTRMVIWGSGASTNTGGQYDLSANSWTATSTAGAPSGSGGHAAVWTGSQMLVWGGGSGAGGRYAPASDSWTALSSVSAPQNRSKPGAVWTGTRMVVWGGAASGATLDTGGRYDPASDTWTPTSIGSAPSRRTGHTAIWTGNLMIVWGGGFSGLTNTGGRYDPAVNSWKPTSLVSAPAPMSGHRAIWTGSRMVIWGGSFAGGGRYDPLTDSWAGMSSPAGAVSGTAIWTGTRMIVWGSGGGRYDPAADTWTPVSTVNAPSPRLGHTAVWTGSLMIVWGGAAGGGRYDPVADSWSPTDDTTAPITRSQHAAIWTGSRMLVWGGRNPGLCTQQYNLPGASYDPQGNAWSPIAGSVSGGTQSTAVWTGSRMVVCGGFRQTISPTGCAAAQSFSLPGCGVYDPASDSWVSGNPPVNAPSSRHAHTAVWTGTSVLVWGGTHEQDPVIQYLRDGGALVFGQSLDNDSDGFSECNGDCNDANPAVHPGAAEICNGLDDDCDGTADDGFPDLDADGYPAACGDCNDTNPAIHPGVAELCNLVDDDCDGVTDEGFDLDGDAVTSCGGDCNDANPAIHPGAVEICNHLDDDCDGTADDGFPDLDGDGYAPCAGDCNDSNPAIHPGVTETCNLVDDNCDGVMNEFDQDGDGVYTCAGDCNDANENVKYAPVEVPTLTVGGPSPSLLTWDDQSWAGSETTYDLVSGPFNAVQGWGQGSCLQADIASASYMDNRPDPGLANAWWYLVRAANSCGNGSYGTDSIGQQRQPPVCP